MVLIRNPSASDLQRHHAQVNVHLERTRGIDASYKRFHVDVCPWMTATWNTPCYVA